jgi:saccharopine dehydrogenase (NAD+, L-lysine-forming)
MGTVLIIGTGGVGAVTAHKCADLPEVFSKTVLANRTVSRAEELKRKIGKPNVETAQVDADDPRQVVDLIKKFKPKLVVNTALPYQDIAIMEACLETGVDYLDTANYEHPDSAHFEYKEQWTFDGRFREKGIMALLGSGFDPGVTNIFIAYAKKHHFDEIHDIDIMDANAGDHGHPFATNFNPEINIREVSAEGRYYENGEWKTTPPLSEWREFDFPQVGVKKMYLMYHEELESLVKNFPEIKRIRFYMTFSDQYLNHLRVLENVGMTSIKPVDFEGKKIVPLKFLKAVLPDPSSLGERTKGKTCIGCMMEGVKDGKKKKVYIYNVKDHEDCYREVGSQAISYTTGVPAMIGAKLMMQSVWKGEGVFNVEQFDPDPFMDDLSAYGLPWEEKGY